jgi:hypothetical protein
MSSFAPVPDVPLEGLDLATSSLFKALKEDVEILTGARMNGVRAVMSDNITVQAQDNQQMKRVSAGGNGYATSYPNAASVVYPLVIINYQDYIQLVTDVQNIANDVARLQSVVNSLIGQLRS